MGLKEKADFLYNQSREELEKKKYEKQHEEDKKNSNFVQLYRNQMDNLANLGVENPKALQVFLFLVKHMDGTNALAVSNVALCELLEVSRATLARAIKHLKETGWICVLKSGNSNVYVVNPEVAWTSYGYQKQYCKFNATVMLSPTENVEYLQNKNAFSKFKTIDSNFIKAAQLKKEEFQNFASAIENEEAID